MSIAHNAKKTRRSQGKVLWFWIGIVSFLIIAGAVGYYYIYLRGFGEASCKRGSWAFSRWIRSPVVRDFPVMKPTDDPTYHYCCFSEGGVPPYEEVSYFSNEEERRLRDTLTAYLLARGFRQSEKRAVSMGAICYVKNGIECDLEIKKQGSGEIYVLLIESRVIC